MEISELVSSAFEALTTNKLRTGLATLGIIIGIGAVITDVQFEGEDETMVNVSFQGVNIKASGVTTTPAFDIWMRVDLGAGSYGM